MSEYDTFDEKISFPFVDNPTVTCLKDADVIAEEYKETYVEFARLLGRPLEAGDAEARVFAFPQGPR